MYVLSCVNQFQEKHALSLHDSSLILPHPYTFPHPHNSPSAYTHKIRHIHLKNISEQLSTISWVSTYFKSYRKT